MASFAKIGLNSKVIEVHSLHNDVLKDADGEEQETLGIDFLTKLTGWAVWKQTSYNTSGNTHNSGENSKAFRKNFAAIGFEYDEVRDAFISPKPYPSWVLNEDSCQWDAPVAYPEDGKYYTWNESNKEWVVQEASES